MSRTKPRLEGLFLTQGHKLIRGSQGLYVDRTPECTSFIHWFIRSLNRYSFVSCASSSSLWDTCWSVEPLEEGGGASGEQPELQAGGIGVSQGSSLLLLVQPSSLWRRM